MAEGNDLDATTLALIDSNLKQLDLDVQSDAQEILHIPPEVVGSLLAKDHRQLKLWERHHGVSIEPSGFDTATCFIVVTGKPSQIQACTKAYQRLETRLLRAQASRSVARAESISADNNDNGVSNVWIVIDWSNFELGAKADAQDSSVHRSTHINIACLDHLLLGDPPRACHTKLVVGTNISPRYCRQLRDLGYQVTSDARPDGAKEYGADDLLHAMVLSLLAGEQQLDSPSCNHVLVLVTGDGNANTEGQGSNFVQVVEMALAQGWAVELWAWRGHCSRRLMAIKGVSSILGINVLICYERGAIVNHGHLILSVDFRSPSGCLIPT
eukprot:TRINITY_DN7433_c0_g1_i4.p1 TRINITY_DN7433_c0_g1~~TRINITY_DN7433_c0_g1_i4.p1  ORF type:complete len:327 (+),score=51.27 TRINITY_DN7433_c0_g1_i4:171-1151(+)